MTTLEQRFVDAVDELQLPDTDLVAAVTATIEPESVTAKTPRRRWLIGVIAACVVAASVLFAPLQAVAQWLGIGATAIVVEPSVDGSDELSSASPLLGVETLGGVPADAALNPLPEFGEPSAVRDHLAVRGRSYVWAASAEIPPIGQSQIGIILYIRPVEGPAEGKNVVQGIVFETVPIDTPGGAVPGLWIDDEHLSTRAGSEQPVVADRVLLWVVDDIQYRLEADVGLPAMVEIAESFEGGTELLPPG